MVASAVPRNASGRWWQWLVVGGCASVAVIASVYALSLGFTPELLLISVGPYVAYLATGTIAMFRRPGNAVGSLMLATGVTGFMSAMLLSPDPVVARIGLTAAGLNNTLVAWLMFASPTGHLTSNLDRVVLVGLGISFVGVNLFDLAWIRSYEGWIGVAIALILFALVTRRWLGASHVARRALSPVVVASALTSLTFALNSAVQILAIPVGPGTAFYAADAIARALIPFGFLLGLLRLRIARGAVADLVVELGETPAPERLREALAGALGDPSLEVVYWSSPFQTYLDSDGVPIELAADTSGRAVTLLARDGEPLAAILHDPALAEDPGLVAAVGAVRPAGGRQRAPGGRGPFAARRGPGLANPDRGSRRTPSGDGSSATSTTALSSASLRCRSPSAGRRRSCRPMPGRS